ncbi:MAG: hypothetical protein KY467_14200 [Gemmatimonadetes bacterium]|nr:hypothetical protein [Gemmatimonadota bacterium]
MRRVRCAALAAMLVGGACGREDAAEAGTAPAADAAAADTSAIAVARRVLGPQVRMAVPFGLPGRDTRFIAAALPVTQPVDDPARPGNRIAPGGHEIVVVELRGGGHAIQKPGLYATREPFLPPAGDAAAAAPADSTQLARMMGVEDANGDGDPEVWAAQYRESRGAHTWDVRAYDRGGRTTYQLVATTRQGGAVDAAARSFSANTGQEPAVREWLGAKLDQLQAALASAPAGGSR